MASQSQPPVIVLIHGGWHLPTHYAALISHLRSSPAPANLEVHCPRLPSTNGSRPPNADLYADSALIHSYVSSIIESGRDVIGVMHSYGGQVGTNALSGLSSKIRAKEGKTGGVKGLVFLCSNVMARGKSMVDLVKEFGHEHLMPLAFDFAEDGTVVCRDPRSILVGELSSSKLTEAEAGKYVDELVRWNGTGMYQPVVNVPAWKEVERVAYVHTLRDSTVPIEYQRKGVEGMRREGVQVETVELETGHCPNATMPAEVAEVIVRMAEAVQKE